LILDLVDHRFLDRMPASMLIVTRETRWPIQKILLVLKSEDNDEPAVDWAIRLAHLAKAKVTILPQIPVPPLMFVDLHQKLNPGNLLTSTYPLGKRLREITHRLNSQDVQGTLRIRHEPLDQQVRCEILENPYDVIVMGANHQNLVQHWVIGEMVNPLLHWARIPILLAKPSKRKQYEY
jgi:nucleotide-binding universal stress UspA family protein